MLLLLLVLVLLMVLLQKMFICKYKDTPRSFIASSASINTVVVDGVVSASTLNARLLVLLVLLLYSASAAVMGVYIYNSVNVLQCCCIALLARPLRYCCCSGYNNP